MLFSAIAVLIEGMPHIRRRSQSNVCNIGFIDATSKTHMGFVFAPLGFRSYFKHQTNFFSRYPWQTARPFLLTAIEISFKEWGCSPFRIWRRVSSESFSFTQLFTCFPNSSTEFTALF